MTMARILITGFEPFADYHQNISQIVVEQFPTLLRLDDPWSDLRQDLLESIELSVEKMVLSVDGEGASKVSRLLNDGCKWDAIVHLGLCGSCEKTRIETLAQNKIQMKIPDNSGRQISGSIYSDLGDFKSNLPVNSWMNLSWPIDCEISKDAGAFVCYETFYHSLHTLDKIGDKQTRCLFVHLPVEEKCTIEEASSFLSEVIQRMFFRPVVSVVGGLIWRNGCYLVGRRKGGEMHAGKWEFPGGKVEPNESKIQAIEREMMEEFSWQVSASPSIGTWHHSLPDVDIALHIMPLELKSKNLDNQIAWTSHDSVSWRTLSDDTFLDWLGNDGMVVEWMRKNQYRG